ncbi:hypothetical protein CFOL_v3_34816 [Cephalotus follicularis]|uniref:Retrovirus-related Pol polyprotein from transposon TNT 1-94-like beta-barrel domain-containing protein n=1 Tax=Cephalotus follicularis TaxID=3775 RepID=A0A1Q3DG43_CEPFO|nr:hypothetical protein CFOL_v3_34816 [Cephalotus follicularis]
MDIGDICIADSATTHTILQNEKYFSYLTIAKANVGTISGTSDIIEGSGMTSFMLSNGTQMRITDALYSKKSRRNFVRVSTSPHRWLMQSMLSKHARHDAELHVQKWRERSNLGQR